MASDEGSYGMTGEEAWEVGFEGHQRWSLSLAIQWGWRVEGEGVRPGRRYGHGFGAWVQFSGSVELEGFKDKGVFILLRYSYHCRALSTASATGDGDSGEQEIKWFIKAVRRLVSRVVFAVNIVGVDVTDEGGVKDDRMDTFENIIDCCILVSPAPLVFNNSCVVSIHNEVVSFRDKRGESPSTWYESLYLPVVADNDANTNVRASI
ncbi:hypothetical protein HYDPIDRAFT_170611 [Hydnomerulius pinastri MD-312]|uniref:Uncharacterized protein n=1 Tax=Hydnomerulius pinastri MD-312 TaxID=994086 RepID=A0A0C9W1N3_9AGAM|nr:hypothetical protein HYDPIDRAFT_170611 [Hydnomerulius pinastri MD-312]